MIDKTEAIALRIYPFSRTSHMVVWLAQDGRRITTSIKGATRSKSTFLGQYDLFYTCELLYYTRERGGVHIAKECCPLKLRENLRANWRAAQCASWFSALAFDVADNPGAGRQLYALLSETLDFIAATSFAPPPMVFARYEAKILELAGIAPNLAPCAVCPDGPARETFRFNLAAGTCHCPEHSPKDAHDPVIAVSCRTAGLYREALQSRSLGLQSPIARTGGPHAFALLRFLGLFMRYHLDGVPIEGRAVALKALAGPVAAPPPALSN